ncbi:D-glycero-beta-D-manno-heptose 1-phosphate adenylyltransferase [Draconibacterium sp. IB214405]|uniref:D-glycero-beta-D-manno-heptose 1-phosphate adenylyltransferase n=1 Tax=Draconibacterium sp. IB214405 TaxID=3097352 RepID=UPI002A176CDC|nr:D-glycero-beta-D-manno-heptose 1-phosphate adenylyltransferase [Draconibacterium sp. IB214405]MDX8338258.1 D-glycero-beta-D-manno-heptose 1-phosphate adenylyltransferase [Draconibacterium sp. IB214405]
MNTKSKIFRDFKSFHPLLKTWKESDNTIVFTNGCFDIIHNGHVDSLQKSAAFGTKLIVGLNSDTSVKLLKGDKRPILNEQPRAEILAAFACIDAVIIFEEETPADIIAKIIPDVLVKGAQYEIHEIAGHDTVLNNGGKVETLELIEGISTSEIIDRIKKL